MKGEWIYNDSKKVEILNEQFASICTMDDKGINKSIPADALSLASTKFDITNKICSDEIEKVLKLSNSNKACSSEVTSKMVEESSDVTNEALADICNQSIAEGEFPMCFKVGAIYLLYKDGEPWLVNNYRPVTLFHILSKPLERVVYTQLYNYLAKNNLLTCLQSGCRHRDSTINQFRSRSCAGI
ncbi:unnamed protein product [Didymodactylos carnosus]|uniref:Reverse transcriptase n=1 Tax=Didymodactylos carnosus TaxID=1234261 RepID=A0A814X1G6_9BILA|nr:unnamed protein product [Didymodactylos carnosus]CAF3973057.1 unnamed protein product [Didymodactylos carnosus]